MSVLRAAHNEEVVFVGKIVTDMVKPSAPPGYQLGYVELACLEAFVEYFEANPATISVSGPSGRLDALRAALPSHLELIAGCSVNVDVNDSESRQSGWAYVADPAYAFVHPVGAAAADPGSSPLYFVAKDDSGEMYYRAYVVGIFVAPYEGGAG